MAGQKQAHDQPVCGARKKSGGACLANAGAGTDHRGTGRCKWHGGGRGTGAPKGNRNAVKSGRYETIFVDVLDEDEQEAFAGLTKRTQGELLEEEIALTTIRERRMLRRIQSLQSVASGMTTVEETAEAIAAREPEPFRVPDRVARALSDQDLNELQAIAAAGGDLPDRIAAQLATEDVDVLAEALAAAAGKSVTKRKSKRTGVLGQIQSIEADLTAVQAHKARLIKLKDELDNRGGGAGDDEDFNGSLFDEDPDDAGEPAA